MLERRDFIGLVPGWPGDDGSLVHDRSAVSVELGGHGAVTVRGEVPPPQLGVLVPKLERLVPRGPLVDQLAPPTVPFRVPLLVEDLICQVVRLNYRARHRGGDFFPRTSQPQDRTHHEFEPLGGLGRARSRLVGLRVVENRVIRPNRFSIGPRELHPPNPAGDPADRNDRPAGFASRDGRQNDRRS